jgi:hypothetical protein
VARRLGSVVAPDADSPLRVAADRVSEMSNDRDHYADAEQDADDDQDCGHWSPPLALTRAGTHSFPITSTRIHRQCNADYQPRAVKLGTMAL